MKQDKEQSREIENRTRTALQDNEQEKLIQ